MNLVANKKILLIAVIVGLVIVIAFVLGSLLLNKSNTTSTTSSSTTSSSKVSSINVSGQSGNNSAVVDLNLSDPTSKLPTVTLSDAPITSNGSSLLSIGSSMSSTLTSVLSSASGISSIISSSSSSNQTDPKAPTNLYVTNKDYKTWSVIWTTITPTIGKLKYGTTLSNLNNTLSDDRTSLSGKTSYSHEVSITNADTLLNQGNPTFYYKIVSDNTEYGNGSSPYSYVNAPLLSSPSSPVNAVINISKAISDNDGVVLGRLKSGNTYSDWISSVVSGTNSILSLGIARNTDLKSYMTPASPSTLEVSVLGPNGKIIGTKTGISLSGIEDAVITVTITPTVSSVSSLSSLHISTSSTVISNMSSDITSNTSSITTVPKTGIEDDLSLALVLVIFLIILTGATLSLYNINSRQNFRRKVLEGHEK